jgi:hypothetical protein
MEILDLFQDSVEKLAKYHVAKMALFYLQVAPEKLEAYLNGFGKYVIQQSRSNLTKQRKNVDKNLYNSLNFEKNERKNSFQLSFNMKDYGKFQDKGVKGKTSSSKAPNSPFRFGSGTGEKGGLTEGIREWVRKKRFQFKDRKTGKFLSYESTAFLISRSIYHTGIKPSLFFTKPFEKAFQTMPDEVVKAYGLDVEKFLQSTIKK